MVLTAWIRCSCFSVIVGFEYLKSAKAMSQSKSLTDKCGPDCVLLRVVAESAVCKLYQIELVVKL